MDDRLRQLVDTSLAAVSAKSLDQAMALYAPGAVLIDPHYPMQRMEGRDAIIAGLSWVFVTMRELNFEVDHFYSTADGTGAAAEVTSDHVLRNGRPVHLRQVFIVDTDDGLITRWQAYEPYGPHGIAGVARRLSAIRGRLRR